LQIKKIKVPIERFFAMMLQSYGVKNPIYIEYRGNGQNYSYFKPGSVWRNRLACYTFKQYQKGCEFEPFPGQLLFFFRTFKSCIFER